MNDPDREVILIKTHSSDFFEVISRGQGGTTAAAHNTAWLWHADITKSHNWYYDVGADFIGESNAQIGSGNPFTNSGAFDFTLLVATNDGFDASAYFTEDAAGSFYDNDGWGRGAFAFVGSSPSEPAPVSITGGTLTGGTLQ